MELQIFQISSWVGWGNIWQLGLLGQPHVDDDDFTIHEALWIYSPEFFPVQDGGFRDFGAAHVNGYGSIPINSIFRGLFTSINPSYFDVNYRGTWFWPIPKYEMFQSPHLSICQSSHLGGFPPSVWSSGACEICEGMEESFFGDRFGMVYPLVNVYIAMESHHF